MALIHHCSLSSTKLSKGLFSWLRRENSPFLVLADTLLPVEVQGPEDWLRLRTGGGEGVIWSPSQTGWEGSSSSVGAGVEARWQNPTSVLSVMVMAGSSPFPRWRWMALKYAFMSCMISVSCDGETERERERGQTGGSLKCLHCHRRVETHD